MSGTVLGSNNVSMKLAHYVPDHIDFTCSGGRQTQ